MLLTTHNIESTKQERKKKEENRRRKEERKSKKEKNVITNSVCTYATTCVCVNQRIHSLYSTHTHTHFLAQLASCPQTEILSVYECILEKNDRKRWGGENVARSRKKNDVDEREIENNTR